MAFDLLYFAWVRERVGRDAERVEPPASVATVADVIDWLAARGEPYASALSDRDRLRAAVDQRFVPLNHSVTGAHEVALFPPVTGG